MDVKELERLAKESVTSALDIFEYSPPRSDMNMVFTELQESEGFGTAITKVIQTPLPAEAVLEDEQKMDAVCIDLEKQIPSSLKFKDECINLIGHTLNPCTFWEFDEMKFKRSFESFSARLNGKDSCRLVLPLFGFGGDKDLWKKSFVFTPVSASSGIVVKNVEIRVISLDELTDYSQDSLSKIGRLNIIIHNLAFVAVFDFEFDGSYPERETELVLYVEQFLKALRLYSGSRIGSIDILCMYNLDLAYPFHVSLDREVRYGKAKRVFSSEDMNQFAQLWTRFATISQNKISWSIQRFLKAFAEFGHVDRCIDSFIALESLLGSPHYALALRAAATIGIDDEIDYEVFDFAQKIMDVRNKIFHGSSNPFEKVKEAYNVGEFITAMQSLTRGCILRAIWLDQVTNTKYRALRDIIEKSIWDESTRIVLRKKIPKWARSSIPIPAKIKKK